MPEREEDEGRYPDMPDGDGSELGANRFALARGSTRPYPNAIAPITVSNILEITRGATTDCYSPIRRNSNRISPYRKKVELFGIAKFWEKHNIR